MNEAKGRPIPRSFRISPELVERLRAAAELDRRSMTKALEEAIEMYCEKVERERGKEAA